MKTTLLNSISLHKNVKLTDLRKDVLNILYDNKTPMGAYEVLEELKQHRDGAEPSVGPPCRQSARMGGVKHQRHGWADFAHRSWRTGHCS